VSRVVLLFYRYSVASIKMRVFVTGGAGFIGRAVVKELLDNGHQVLGLARSSSNAEILTKAGAEVHQGDLEDLESLKNGARTTEGVIHLAFIHDFSDLAKAIRVDRAAIEAMGEAIAGTGKPLVIASGTLGVSSGKLATEETDPERNDLMSVRYSSADLVYLLTKEKIYKNQKCFLWRYPFPLQITSISKLDIKIQ